jgi:hypothetical protein
MSAQDQIGRLNGLLERIKRNSGRPRAARAAAPAAATPAAGAAAAPPSAADQSVDDLLGAMPAPSPLPVEVEVSLESAPPPEDGLGVDSEVSEVRVTTATREAAVEVTVASIEAEAEPIGAEELSEDDLVEVTDLTSVPPPVTTDVDIDFEDEDEQPPASSQRSRVASSMDEALAAAAAQMDAEREDPIKTPPPESGPQAAPMPAGLAAPAAPDVDALLGQELDIPTRAQDAGPTTEQLGQTIDLEEARGPALELAEPKSTAAPEPKPVEELEVTLPGREVVGGYHHQLEPPPEARDDLEAHRRRLEADAPSPQEASPEIVARPVPVSSPSTFGSVREGFQPSSFVELLDASLQLSGE